MVIRHVDGAVRRSKKATRSSVKSGCCITMITGKSLVSAVDEVYVQYYSQLDPTLFLPSSHCGGWIKELG